MKSCCFLLENGWNGLKTHDIDIKNQESWLEDENFENLRKWEVFGPLLGHFGAALRLLWGCFRTTLGLLWGRFRTTLGMLLGCIEAASGTLRGTSGMLRGHSGAPVLWGLGPLYSALLLGITIQIAYSGSWD